tara:strand:- start:473 stop:979 length:507 start_codon:yes stop_codon:yes gene_type:complete
MQEFIEIKGFEGRYAINLKGDVLNIKKNSILKPYTNGVGYYRITFYGKNKKRHQFYVHRLIALHFIPNPEKKGFINHIDGNPSNNDINNLEWCTKSENGKHAYKIGLNYNNPKRGEDNHNSILNDSIVRDIRNRHKNGERQCDISKDLNLSTAHINNIVLNKIWKHLK